MSEISMFNTGKVCAIGRQGAYVHWFGIYGSEYVCGIYILYRLSCNYVMRDLLDFSICQYVMRDGHTNI